MRVFCPEHKRGFFAPRQSPIKCENRGHVLGEIDFEGGALSPVEIQWQYCCNCEHFCPADFDQYGLQRCPVCTRKSSLLYLCDRCHVISFESNTPLETKNFTLTPEGVPQPSCPGCLQPASADLHEHNCDDFNVSFVTPLTTCPLCEERLDLAPSFPSRVSDYLKRTKTSRKANVTFDYETGTFVPIEDGEFVLVTNPDDAIVLPRAAKFANKRDFYDFYQDYYHCPNPAAGDVLIIHPAVVTQTNEGWTLQATGVLEVFAEQPNQKILTPPAPAPGVQPPNVKRESPPTEPLATIEPVQTKAAATKEGPEAKACPECGSMIEAKYAFCWKCGHELSDQSRPNSNSHNKPGTLPATALGDEEDDELTVQHESPLRSVSFTNARPSARPAAARGSVLKLIAIATISVLLVSLGLFSLFRTDATTATATATAATEVEQPNPAATITTEVSRSAPTETTTQQVVPTPDEELKNLRDRRLKARPSERSKIFQAFAKIEKQYPRDYRFPYERAKLAAKGSKANSRSEAFKALTAAAEKAIKTGKATEMLSGLESDKVTDFNQLAQGRYGWARLVAALRRRDTSLLSE
jgi:hypothetical protein